MVQKRRVVQKKESGPGMKGSTAKKGDREMKGRPDIKCG